MGRRRFRRRPGRYDAILSDVYYWDENKTDWENIIKSYFRSLLVRELFIIMKRMK